MWSRISFACVLLAAGVSASCGDDSDDVETDLSCGGQAVYANPGPFAVGVTTVNLGDTPVEVWYPATTAGQDRDVYDLRDWLPDVGDPLNPDVSEPSFETAAYRDTPVRTGLHPVVVFSHGLGGYRSQSTFFTTHLASWGFIVAAPDHPERGLQILVSATLPVFDQAPSTLLQTINLLSQLNEDPSSAFFGRVDASAVASAGHSAGAAAAAAAALDPAITTWVGHAGAGSVLSDKPALIIAGETDDTVPAAELEAIFSTLQGSPPQRYLSIFGAGHLAFSDICLIGREEGGLLQLARNFDVEIPALFESLASDGCERGDLPAERAWPVINHYSTAHLFEALGLPGAQAGFTSDARACFDPLVLDAQ